MTPRGEKSSLAFGARRSTTFLRLSRLIGIATRELGRGDYSEEQIEAALGTALGVDSQLVRDGTYFVAEAGGSLVACGGWSSRKTLFGSDGNGDRQPESLDPARDGARIRAFFVHPDWARQGLGRRMLELCEAEARANGFRSAELMATSAGRAPLQTLRICRGARHSAHAARRDRDRVRAHEQALCSGVRDRCE